MRTRLFAVLAFGALSLSTAAAQQPGCYYSTADQLWVCPPQARYAAPYGRGYATRADCRVRYGRWVCRPYRY